MWVFSCAMMRGSSHVFILKLWSRTQFVVFDHAFSLVKPAVSWTLVVVQSLEPLNAFGVVYRRPGAGLFCTCVPPPVTALKRLRRHVG